MKLQEQANKQDSSPADKDRQNEDDPRVQSLNYKLLEYPGDCPSGM